jgi:hypothetical protein
LNQPWAVKVLNPGRAAVDAKEWSELAVKLKMPPLADE